MIKEYSPQQSFFKQFSTTTTKQTNNTRKNVILNKSISTQTKQNDNKQINKDRKTNSRLLFRIKKQVMKERARNVFYYSNTLLITISHAFHTSG